MNFFIIIICIKNHMSAFQSLFLLGLSLLNQTLLELSYLRDIESYSLLLWLVYPSGFIMISLITLRQNIEVVYFSIFAFVVTYGLNNQKVDIMNPLFLSIILMTLLFSPTIY